MVGVISRTRVGRWRGLETVLLWNLRHAVCSERQVFSHCLALGMLSRARSGASLAIMWLLNDPVVVSTRPGQQSTERSDMPELTIKSLKLEYSKASAILRTPHLAFNNPHSQKQLCPIPPRLGTRTNTLIASRTYTAWSSMLQLRKHHLAKVARWR